jgi:hypothetical protein
MIVVAMITAMTFSASGAAPTPLLYQEHFGLTPALVTVIFAAYVLSLLLALLLSRSPPIQRSLSMLCF